MNSYIAKLVFQIICGAGNHTAQFDEQLRLILAENAELAFESALQIGGEEQTSFYNRKDQLVQWKFIGVSNLHELGKLEHATEIYSAITERDDGERFVQEVKIRSRLLNERFTIKITEEVQQEIAAGVAEIKYF